MISVPLNFPPNLDFRGALSTWLQMREVIFGNETYMGVMLASYDSATGNASAIVLPWQGIDFSIPDKMNIASSSGKLSSLGIAVQPSFTFPPMSPITEGAEPSQSDEPSQSTNPAVEVTSDAGNNSLTLFYYVNVIASLVATSVFMVLK